MFSCKHHNSCGDCALDNFLVNYLLTEGYITSHQLKDLTKQFIHKFPEFESVTCVACDNIHPDIEMAPCLNCCKQLCRDCLQQFRQCDICQTEGCSVCIKKFTTGDYCCRDC